MVVTVQVQLSLSEFTVTHLLPYLLTFPDSETFSGRNQRIGCVLAWVTIVRDSESEHPFYLWGNSTGFANVTNFLPSYCGRFYDNCFSNHSTVFKGGCDWTNVGHPSCLLNILIDSWSFIAVLTAPKTNKFGLIKFMKTDPLTRLIHVARWHSF